MPTAKKKARRAQAEPVTFLPALLAYLQVAVEGPLGPGGIAHRIQRYPVIVLGRDGYTRQDEIVGPACGTTTTQPVPGHDPDDDGPAEQTVPVVVCCDHSAAFAQAHGVTRCAHDACWPLNPDEHLKAGTP